MMLNEADVNAGPQRPAAHSKKQKTGDMSGTRLLLLLFFFLCPLAQSRRLKIKQLWLDMALILLLL